MKCSMDKLRKAGIVAVLSLILPIPGVSLSDPTAKSILERADEVRNPQSDYTVDVTVTGQGTENS